MRERERRVTKRPFASKSEELYSSNALVPLAQGGASEMERQLWRNKRVEESVVRWKERDRTMERTARSGGGGRGRITMRGLREGESPFDLAAARDLTHMHACFWPLNMDSHECTNTSRQLKSLFSLTLPHSTGWVLRSTVHSQGTLLLLDVYNKHRASQLNRVAYNFSRKIIC